MSEEKKISINFIIQCLNFTANLAISFFLTPVIIRFIGQDIYGFASLANQFTGYASLFSVAFNSMLTRYITISVSKGENTEASEYFSSIFFTNVILMVALAPLAGILVLFLQKFINLPAGHVGDIKLLFGFIFCGFLLNLPGSVFDSAAFAKNRLDLSNGSSLLCNGFRILVILFLLFNFKPYIWYIGLASLLSTLVMIALNITFKRKLLPNVKLSVKFFRVQKIKEVFSVGVWNSVNQLNQILLTGLDLVVANLWVGISEMNLLSYGKMLPVQVLSLITMTAGVFAPTLTITYGNSDLQTFTQKLKLALKICGYFCSVFVVGMIIFGQPFYKLWLGALPESSISTISIISILTILPQFFSVYIYPLYSVNTITTKIKWPVLVLFLIGVLNIILVYFLTKFTNLGVFAVAGTSSILSLFNILIFIPIYVSKTLGQPWFTFYPTVLRGMFNNIVLMTVFWLISIFIKVNSWLSFLAAVVVAAIIGYMFGFFILFTRKERRSMVQRFFRKEVVHG